MVLAARLVPVVSSTDDADDLDDLDVTSRLRKYVVTRDAPARVAWLFPMEDGDMMRARYHGVRVHALTLLGQSRTVTLGWDDDLRSLYYDDDDE